MRAKDPGGPSVIQQLAAYVASESFDKLPEATVRAARRAILDTLGVMLAGSAEVTAARVRALIAHRRGVEEATIAGTDLRGLGGGRRARERDGGARPRLR
jgi:2-methylcitrate dehydratase PrpD